MRRDRLVLSFLIIFLLGSFACKSVETTSAMLHNQNKNYEKAIEMAKLGIEKNPNDAEAYFQLGVSYSYTKKMRLAYENFRKAAELDPKGKQKDCEDNIMSNWARHFNSGIEEFGAENPEGAANEFFEATEADPRRMKGWLNLAMAYNEMARQDSTYREKSYAAADSLMAKVTEEDEEYGKALALSGQVMINRGREDEALVMFEKLMLDDPTNSEVLEEIAAEFMYNEKYELAEKFYDMAIQGRRKTDTENFDVYYNLGRASMKTENYIKAIDAYQNALLMDPENPSVNYALLFAYYQAEYWDEAIMQGDKCKELSPDNINVWHILSIACNKKGMKKKAEEYMEKFMELKGNM
ncbi:MAG: tetratricopeptide repeat protein [Candidatus Krumholzibacteriota bacterium]|nr:tetratricopeptide repeat protein [Candidatus Krumholzibacteriota bacterium]